MINIFRKMITYCFKLLLVVCITIAAFTLIVQNDWNNLIRKPKMVVSQIPTLMASNSFLNNIFGVLNPRTMSPPSTNLETRIREMIHKKSNKQMRKLLDQNSIYHLIKNYLMTFMVNNSSTNYTYEDVGNNYTGPIVEGWPPTKSRNISEYISTQTVLKKLSSNCSHGLLNYNLLRVDGELELLIMQHSAPYNFEARQSSRNTWMKYLKVFNN